MESGRRSTSSGGRKVLRSTSVSPYIRNRRACGWARRSARTTGTGRCPPALVAMRSDGIGSSRNAATLSSCCHSGGTPASTVIACARRSATSCAARGERSTTRVAPLPAAHSTWLMPYTKLNGSALAIRSVPTMPR